MGFLFFKMFHQHIEKEFYIIENIQLNLENNNNKIKKTLYFNLSKEFIKNRYHIFYGMINSGSRENSP